MTDIQAAVGREQLKKSAEVVARRREQAQRYRQLLAVIPGLALPADAGWARSNWQSFCVRLRGGCDRRQIMQVLLNAGTAARLGTMCAHQEPASLREAWSCGQGPGQCAMRREAAGSCTRVNGTGTGQFSCDCATR